jgi:DNA-binding MarR family transcriptional regulator
MTLTPLLTLAQTCKEEGISLSHLCILVSIEDGPKTPSQIAKALAITPAAMTGQIDALAAKGKIERHDDERDRRRVHIRLTPTGRQILHTATERLQSLAA